MIWREWTPVDFNLGWPLGREVLLTSAERLAATTFEGLWRMLIKAHVSRSVPLHTEVTVLASANLK